MVTIKGVPVIILCPKIFVVLFSICKAEYEKIKKDWFDIKVESITRWIIFCNICRCVNCCEFDIQKEASDLSIKCFSGASFSEPVLISKGFS